MITETTEAKILSREEVQLALQEAGGARFNAGRAFEYGDDARKDSAVKQAKLHESTILAAYDALLAERDDLADRLDAALAEVVDSPDDPGPGSCAMRWLDRLESAARHVRAALADPDVSAVVAVLTAATFTASLAAGWIARRK